MANGPVPVGAAISSAVPRESNFDSPRKAFCGFQRKSVAVDMEEIKRQTAIVEQSGCAGDLH
jgi:hypothetical protein